MKYLYYRINTLEAIKMGSQMVSNSIHYSLNYLAGSSLRGALISSYLQQYNVDLNADIELKVSLLKGVYFLNAYPAAGEQMSLPAPWNFFGAKKELSLYQGGPLSVKNSFEGIEVGDKAVKKEPFVLYDEETVYGIKVQKKYQLHISLNGNNANEMPDMNGNRADKRRNMYRYEAIGAGQSFIGALVFTDGAEELAPQFEELLQSRKIIYVGGSKGSGYGKCEIEYLKGYDHEKPAALKHFTDKEFYIYFVSDALINNERGEMVSYIDEEYLSEKLGLEVISYEDGVSDSVKITGYNATWKSSLPQYEGIKAGSIHRYSCRDPFDPDNNEALRDRIKALEDRGIGLRKEDGYGRILIIGKLHQENWQRWKAESTEGGGRIEGDKPIGVSGVCLSKESEKILRDIVLKGLYEEKVQRSIDRKVVEEYDEITSNRLHKSQLGKLRDKIDVYQGSMGKKGIESAQKSIKEYFDHMKEKENNLKAYRQFEDTKIKGISFDKYMIDFILNGADVNEFISRDGFEPISANDVTYEPDESTVFRLNLIFMDKFIRYILRNAEKEA